MTPTGWSGSTASMRLWLYYIVYNTRTLYDSYNTIHYSGNKIIANIQESLHAYTYTKDWG